MSTSFECATIRAHSPSKAESGIGDAGQYPFIKLKITSIGVMSLTGLATPKARPEIVIMLSEATREAASGAAMTMAAGGTTPALIAASTMFPFGRLVPL
jgi:hypothetical protein